MNFNASQAELPSQVREQVVDAVNHWSPAKQSLLNISHTNPSFRALADDIQKRFRVMLNVPESHAILIIPAGARYQFSQCAMFLSQYTNHVKYILSGHWSKVAAKTAENWLKAECYSFKNFQNVINDSNQSWVFYTDNETIEGIEFSKPPTHAKLIADMTSNIFTRHVNWGAHDIVFASCQKNLGISGSCVVVINKDLLANDREDIFSYRLAYQQRSLHVTPSILAWYTLHEMLKWYEESGGIAYFEKKVETLSNKLYSKLDNMPMVTNLIDDRWRSRVSVVFDLIDSLSTDHFLQIAEAEGFSGLRGHKFRGGIRISLYNSIHPTSVDELIKFMDYYGKKYT